MRRKVNRENSRGVSHAPLHYAISPHLIKSFPKSQFLDKTTAFIIIANKTIQINFNSTIDDVKSIATNNRKIKAFKNYGGLLPLVLWYPQARKANTLFPESNG